MNFFIRIFLSFFVIYIVAMTIALVVTEKARYLSFKELSFYTTISTNIPLIIVTAMQVFAMRNQVKLMQLSYDRSRAIKLARYLKLINNLCDQLRPKELYRVVSNPSCSEMPTSTSYTLNTREAYYF